MFRSLITFATLICLIASSSLLADCCQSVDVSVGWRRDYVDWKVSRIHSSGYTPGRAKSEISFKDINSYTISAKSKWAGSAYYVRLSGEYATTFKGQAHEHFRVNSPYLYFPVDVHTSDPIRRNSEIFDIDGAVGYPLSFCCCRLSVVPLIGFSFHRQRLRVKAHKKCCHSGCPCESSNDIDINGYSSSTSATSSCCSSSCNFCESSSGEFCLCSSNPFIYADCTNPFSSSSDTNIPHELGLCTHHRTSSYRFTWYGFYLGADIAYALDSCWTLFSELEFHGFNRAHGKRMSRTGVHFVDEYHKKGWAYGFNGVLGATYCICNCWYGTLGVDFRWWKSNSKHDDLEWKMVGANIGIGYVF